MRVVDFEHPEDARENGWRPRDFEGATFVAFVNQGSVTFDKYDQLRLTLTIPGEYADAAADVHLAARLSIPLAVRMEPFKPYLHLKERQAREFKEFLSRVSDRAAKPLS